MKKFIENNIQSILNGCMLLCGFAAAVVLVLLIKNLLLCQ